MTNWAFRNARMTAGALGMVVVSLILAGAQFASSGFPLPLA